MPMDGSVTLLDVRTHSEYARGHIEGFINIPVDSLRERISELDSSKPVYVICQSGVRQLYCERGYLWDAALSHTILPEASASTTL